MAVGFAVLSVVAGDCGRLTDCENEDDDEDESGVPRTVRETSMSPKTLWILAVLFTIGAIFLFFFHLPGTRSEMEKRGTREDGTIVMKDSLPMGDGNTIYKVMFVYVDAKKQNHSIWNQMSDAGLWNSLEEKKTVKIYYLPDRPDQAIIPGADAVVPEGVGAVEVPKSTKRAGALRFLAWSLLIFSLPCYYYAFMGTVNPKEPKPKPPVIARR